MARQLSRQERIEARHWLQVLSEHAKIVRNAMDPVSGMQSVTDIAWNDQWMALKADLEKFTVRVMRNAPSVGGLYDRNA